MENLLEINGLTVELMTERGIVYALSGVDLNVAHGQIHGVVGESGCGKSMTAKSIMRLHNPKRSRMGGTILFEGEDIAAMEIKEVERLRGKDISMIFQDPAMSLNPLMSVGNQIAEMARVHLKSSKAEARQIALGMLEKVGLSPAINRYRQYPFELSGGMQQRVMIAIAIACSPKLLIADEPTTALDATIQAQILELIQSLSDEMGMSVLFITHNFGIVAEICSAVSVMYQGRVVETGYTRSVLDNPAHPYTAALIASIPTMALESQKRLGSIPGRPDTLYENLSYCPFCARCPQAFGQCRNERPGYQYLEDGHRAACFGIGG
ncbi:MAG: ABC transporter ATP-binding protein [Eubacteriaceae bacterium]|nr:ABC transporter ATP-binding protein [Eubacteriaceae bacterium]